MLKLIMLIPTFYNTLNIRENNGSETVRVTIVDYLLNYVLSFYHAQLILNQGLNLLIGLRCTISRILCQQPEILSHADKSYNSIIHPKPGIELSDRMSCVINIMNSMSATLDILSH